jgi:hypothetical protein
LRCYLRGDAARNLVAELDGMGAENLLNYPFHDGFDPTPFRTFL